MQMHRVAVSCCCLARAATRRRLLLAAPSASLSSSSPSSASASTSSSSSSSSEASLPRVGHFYADPFTAADFIDRRRRLFRQLSESPQFNKFDRHVLLVPSAQQQYMAHHVPYTLRQNSHLRYLTGHLGANSLLTLSCGRDSEDFKAALFVHRQSPTEQQWDGPDKSLAEVSQLAGLAEVMYTEEEAVNYLIGQLGPANQGSTGLWYNYGEPPNPALDRTVVLPAVQKRSPQGVLNVELLIDRLRWIKSEKELAAMRSAGDVGSKAMTAAMLASGPGVNEALLWSVLDFECRRLGADRLAYPPVIGGADRANTIHYMRNNKSVPAGQLVLIDSGAEVHGYVSDITRAWPVSGKFSTEQRVLYEIVQQLLRDCENYCRPGVSLDSTHLHMGERMKKYLTEAGALSPEGQQASAQSLCQSLCPHHVSHYLGMDVHDTPSVSRSVGLEPFVAFPLEPGIYSGIDADCLRREFKGVGGVRLENDYAIGDAGQLVLLNAGAPLTVEEVENTAGRGYRVEVAGR